MQTAAHAQYEEAAQTRHSKQKTAQAVQLERIVVSEANTDARERLPDSCLFINYAIP